MLRTVFPLTACGGSKSHTEDTEPSVATGYLRTRVTRPEAAQRNHTRAEPAPCRIVVCRDCCCGSPKVSGVDHARQVERLSENAPVRVAACLDVCERANVIVVQPSSAARAAGARPVWLGLVNDSDATEDIAAWVQAGGPGIAPCPDVLDLYIFTPPRRTR